MYFTVHGLLLSLRWLLRPDRVSVSDPWRSEVIHQDEAPDMPMSIIHVWLQRCFSERELDKLDTDRLFTGNLLWLELCDTPSASPIRIHFLLVKGFQLRIRKEKKKEMPKVDDIRDKVRL